MIKMSRLVAYSFVAWGGIAPTTALADIQPNDGHWSGSVALLGHVGCPAEMVSQINQNGAGTQGYANQYLQFPTPFDATVIPGDFVWVRQAENLWHAAHQETKPTPMGALTVTFTHILEIQSSDQMLQNSTVRVVFPAEISAMIGVQGPCQINSAVTHRWVGP